MESVYFFVKLEIKVRKEQGEQQDFLSFVFQ